MTLILNNEEVEQVLTMEESLEAMELAFKDLATDQAVNRPRSHTYTPIGTDRFYCFKSMDGAVPRYGVHAIRLSSDMVQDVVVAGLQREIKLPAAPGDKYLGLVLLFSIERLELLAIMQDGFLQLMRVGATSGLAAKCLSRENSRVVGMFGTGWQAGPQLMALSRVRSVKMVKVYSPTKKHRIAFAREWEKKLGIEINAMDEPREVVRGSDIVVAATNSLEPVFDGRWLEEGQHVNSLQAGELDAVANERAAVIAVRAKDQSTFWSMGNRRPGHMAKCETFDPSWTPKLRELGAILAGLAPGRQGEREITLFGGSGTGPSSGLGIQFAAVGAKIYHAAKARGLGREIPSDWFLETIHP